MGITIGRLISEFITEKLGDKKMIFIGTICIAIGLIFLIINVDNYYVSFAGLIICGIGAGPIYPSIVHFTPSNFGKENSQGIIGLQMAFAYLGSTFAPLLFVHISNYLGISIFPLAMLIFLVIFFILFICLQKCLKKNKKN